jgi:rRNA maturation RNase YbeY
LTDIITFDYSDSESFLSGEIYISIERVRENALKFKVDFEDELNRVMIHGVLHLLGYKDKKPSEKALMRKKEEACLSLRK